MKSIATAIGALFSIACAALLAMAWVLVVMLSLMGGGIVCGMAAIVTKTEAFNRWLDELAADRNQED